MEPSAGSQVSSGTVEAWHGDAAAE